MKNKKAELTTQQIVTMIILIVSFVVILLLLFRLDLGKETEKELCHNSVILRGSSVLPEDVVPLDCSREYICITKDGSCESMTNPEIKKVKTDSDVYQILADEMAECWWMFGEGKVDYVGKDLRENLYCSICSQIAFDDSLNEIIPFSSGTMEKNKFYNYLINENYSEGKTYSEYLFGTDDLNEISGGADFETIGFSNQYFVMTGIYSDVGVWKWVAGGVALAGIVAVPFTSGASLFITKAIIVTTAATGGGVAGSYIGGAVQGQSGKDYFQTTIIEANSEEFKALNCKDILTTA